MELENVLGTFDGISCGQIALNKANITYKQYYASEIDKFASSITRYNYPDTIHLGNIKNINPYDLPKIDLLFGGFPCQGFSYIGKQLGFDDIRSQLFFDLINLKEKLNPKYFLFENVNMKQRDMDTITRICGVNPVLINSGLISAQNRPRVYWTNIGAEPTGLFGDFLECKIPQPPDKGLILYDILEKDVDEKYFLSQKIVDFHYKNSSLQKENGNGFSFRPTIGDRKSFAITTREGSGMDSNFIIVNVDGKDRIRKLTPLECERLQTVPDGYTKYGIDESGNVVEMSNTQRYKTLGNGWTVDTIAYILSFINK